MGQGVCVLSTSRVEQRKFLPILNDLDQVTAIGYIFCGVREVAVSQMGWYWKRGVLRA